MPILPSPTQQLVLRSGEITAKLVTGEALAYVRGLEADSIDLVVTSPPYCIGKSYETSVSAIDFRLLHEGLLPEIERVVRPGGSVCWQVGSHISSAKLVPLDALVYAVSLTHTNLTLRNRIIWTFGHGFHGTRRFSGRHETILWFTKGDNYHFDLDAVRTPQLYPGKRAYKGPRRGELSGNPLGKNPGDVWDIPNVKAGHCEKVDHPCQFPVALVSRLVRALTRAGDTVLDVFMGSGTTGVAAVVDGRNFVGIDIHENYVQLAASRVRSVMDGSPVMRPDIPPTPPVGSHRVATRPAHFHAAAG